MAMLFGVELKLTVVVQASRNAAIGRDGLDVRKVAIGDGQSLKVGSRVEGESRKED
jgi:hypothetical protein